MFHLDVPFSVETKVVRSCVLTLQYYPGSRAERSGADRAFLGVIEIYSIKRVGSRKDIRMGYGQVGR